MGMTLSFLFPWSFFLSFFFYSGQKAFAGGSFPSSRLDFGMMIEVVLFLPSPCGLVISSFFPLLHEDRYIWDTQHFLHPFPFVPMWSNNWEFSLSFS